MMKTMNDVLEDIRDLAGSQGYYGRLYENLMEMQEDDPEGYEKYSKYVEEQELETVLDVVLFFEEGVSPKKSREPKKKVWKLPVTWEMYGEVEIEADTMEEAIKIFNETEEDIGLPVDNEYVDGSFKLSDDNPDELRRLIELMNPENFKEEV